MGARTDMGDLPMIKCSDCGANVDLLAMGDHVCAIGISRTPSPSPPAPPPKSHFQRPTLGSEDAWSNRHGRAEPPSQIDPFRANRPFRPSNAGHDGNDSLFPSPLSPSQGSRSPLHSFPLPRHLANSENIPNFPLPRSMSGRQVNGMAFNDATSAPLASSPGYADAMNYDLYHVPHTAQLPLDTQEDRAPPPLPKDSDPYASHTHQHNISIDSQSSYTTSFSSTRYAGRSSKRSTAVSTRSFGSVSIAGYRYEDDIPPIPRSPNPFDESTYSDSSISDMSFKREGTNEVRGGFDFSGGQPKGGLDKPSPNHLGVPPDANSKRQISPRAITEFFSNPQQPTDDPPDDLPSESELPWPVQQPAGSGKVEYKAFQPSASEYKAFQPSTSNYLQPNSLEQNESGETQRKKSDASSDSAISVSNFARALGLDISDDTVEDSTASSGSSPSEPRSGTSLSSVQSDVSMPKRKPSDLPRLGPVVEHPRNETCEKSDLFLGEAHHTESPTTFEVPRIPESFLSPESPTDPTLGKGGLNLIPEKLRDSKYKQNPLARSATEPIARPHPQGRPRGPCRGCGETIIGKSISSADGRLTGRYHRGCFVCFQCGSALETNDFYVLRDRPYCAQHYHENNGSLCDGCRSGIEGKYLETNERTGPGPADRQKFHVDCLRCRTCNIDLQGEYFEWNGLVYCERDARRAAASVSPNRFHRPTLPSSPLAPNMRPPSRGRPPPPGYPGRGGGRPRPPPASFDGYGPGPGRRPYPGPDRLPPPTPNYLEAPPGPRRFPERRTTKLMMI